MVKIKERTNSSQFANTSELKKVQDVTLRKSSENVALASDNDSSPDRMIKNGTKSPTKNLLTEFEKDETLEPNSSVFMDTYTVVQPTSASTSSGALGPVQPALQLLNKPPSATEATAGEREAGFIGRPERRDQVNRREKQPEN